MEKQSTRKWRNQAASAGKLNEMLDTLLACDWAVVEVSMGLYNVPRTAQAAIREQNQRLHGALREHLLTLVPKRSANGPRALTPGKRKPAKTSVTSLETCRNVNRLS